MWLIYICIGFFLSILFNVLLNTIRNHFKKASEPLTVESCLEMLVGGKFVAGSNGCKFKVTQAGLNGLRCIDEFNCEYSLKWKEFISRGHMFIKPKLNDAVEFLVAHQVVQSELIRSIEELNTINA